MSNRAAGDVGKDLLHDSVAAVLAFNLEITSSNGESVNTAWYRQAGNSSPCPAPACLSRSRTRRTTSREVTAWPFFDANAVYCVSASQTQACSWSSRIARGYRIGPVLVAEGGDRGADAGVRRDGDREHGAAAAYRPDHHGVVRRTPALPQPDAPAAGQNPAARPV